MSRAGCDVGVAAFVPAREPGVAHCDKRNICFPDQKAYDKLQAAACGPAAPAADPFEALTVTAQAARAGDAAALPRWLCDMPDFVTSRSDTPKTAM